MTSRDPISILPVLQPDEERHSAAVLRSIGEAIAASGGWLAFDDYMRIALYAPGLGYYSAGSVKIGAAGDFVTAPELSDLFGRCVARQCAQLLQLCGGDVLELGAGTGALAASVLQALQQLESVPQHYYILEVSADLRARAQQRLSGLPEALRSRLRWLEAMPQAPITGVVLANEVADALPFKRFAVENGTVLELGVALTAAGRLVEAGRPADAELRTQVLRIAASVARPADGRGAMAPQARRAGQVEMMHCPARFRS